MRRTYLAIGALALVALLAIAGCGGGGSTTSGASAGAGGGETEMTAGAGGGQSGGYGYGESSEEPAAAEGENEGAAGGEGAGTAGAGTTVAVVKVMDTPTLGKVIVDSKGMTLYDFHKDKGTTSSCYGECAVAWPPLLTTGKPQAMGGAEGSLLGTTKRKDGTVQVTYAGHPIYGFVEDEKPGETNGNDFNGFGAQWYALLPNGEEPTD